MEPDWWGWSRDRAHQQPLLLGNPRNDIQLLSMNSALRRLAVTVLLFTSACGPTGSSPQQDAREVRPASESEVPAPKREIVEEMTEQERAEVFAFRALADTGLMNPFGKRSYNFTYADDTTQADDGWRIGFAASDCEPRGGAFTCRGLSGEDPELGNALTDTFVTVALGDGRGRVVGVKGNMLDHEQERVIGYTLQQREEASHWEFPAVGMWPGDEGAIIEMMALWVGAYPTSAPGSVCEIQAVNAQGEAVGDRMVFYQEPPSRAFERAGWIRGTQTQPTEDVARLAVDCRQYVGRGWEIGSGPEDLGGPGEVSGVSAEIVWRGDQGFTTGAVCSSTLVDEAGGVVWEGSQRILPLWRPSELKNYPYRSDVLISTRGKSVDAQSIGEFTCKSL